MTKQPIILLTFSNDASDYLPMIVAEQKAIKKALLDFADQNFLQVRDVQHASAEDLFYLINRYHNQIQILHYGGHASGKALRLEKEIGIVQSANIRGIAGLLGTQKNLKLVFLNGCATKGQVKSLLDNGVQAVIATQVKINDRDALDFASQFYEAMASGNTLRESFLKAKALIETKTKRTISSIEETRSMVLDDANDSDEMPWGLFWKQGAEDILDWKLPTESSLELRFNSELIPQKATQSINNLLVDTTLKAIRTSDFVKELARKINKERKEGNPNRRPTDAEKKDAIIRSYPAPISVHLRTLFSNRLAQKFDEDRLNQLLTTYEIGLKLFSIILLSDVWDAITESGKPLELTAEEKLQLQAFFNLNTLSAASFDYFHLSNALLILANRNEVQLYMPQFKEYKSGWASNETLTKANEHFQEMRTALESDVPSKFIEPYCQLSEQYLTAALTEWYFLLQYKMAVIKNIEVVQLKNMPPRKYKHVMVELDNNYNDIGHKDRWQDLEEPTDMESVLLYQDHLNDNLNLSPFVLDENALTREFNSKIYFFSHASAEGLHYYWIENEADTLLITEENHPQILKQFDKAKKDILNENSGEIRKSDIISDDDILEVL